MIRPPPTLRTCTAQDADFIYHVAELTLKPHLAALDKHWSQTRMRQKCEADAGDPNYRIVEIDGHDGGVFCAADGDGVLWLHALMLLPPHQRQGTGALLLAQALQRARLRGVPVRLHVVRTNPAVGFYRRFGFAVRNQDKLHLTMHSPP